MGADKEQVVVEHVMRQSPASCAGLKDGDRIVDVLGKAVHTPREVSLAVAAATDKVRVKLLRAGKELDLDIVPASRPTDTELAQLDLLGTPLPDFAALAVVRGRKRSSSDFKDRMVLVEHGASWCGPCRESEPLLEALSQKYPEQELLVLGVTREKETPKGADAAAPILAPSPPFSAHAPQATFTQLRDPEGTKSGAASVSLLPTFVFYGKDGTARWIQSGFGRDLQAQLNAVIRAEQSKGPGAVLAPAAIRTRDECGRPVKRSAAAAPTGH